MSMNETELFDMFYPIAQQEAERIRRDFKGCLRLYEEDDLINWAYLSGRWKRYSESGGAMRFVIRFAMLRALQKAGHRGIENLPLSTPPDDPVWGAVRQELKDIISDPEIFDEKDREVLLRRLLDEETFTTIGRSVQLTRTATCMRFQRGMKKLRGIYHGEIDE